MANINTGVVKKEEGKQNLAQWLDEMKPQIERALPQHVKADRFIRVFLTALKSNSKLAACDPKTYLAAMMTSAQLGLEVNTPLGEAYIIPYGTDANFQIGYKGLLSLAYRTNMYRMIYAMEVYKNDIFQFEYGLEPKLKHRPAAQPEGDPTHYYAVYHLVNGGMAFRVWTREKVVKHAEQFSQSYKKARSDSPWKTDFDSMGKKTVLIDLLKYAPKSIEFSRALSVDDTVRKEIDQDMDLVPVADDETVIDAEISESNLTDAEQAGLDDAVGQDTLFDGKDEK